MLTRRPGILYGLGAAGLLVAIGAEIAGVDVLAGAGYLAAVVGLLSGFFTDRRRDAS